MVSVAAHSVEFRRVAKLVAIVVRHKRLNHWVGIVGTIDVGGSSTTATTARAVARTKGGPGDAFRCTGGALCFLNYIFFKNIFGTESGYRTVTLGSGLKVIIYLE